MKRNHTEWKGGCAPGWITFDRKTNTRVRVSNTKEIREALYLAEKITESKQRTVEVYVNVFRLYKGLISRTTHREYKAMLDMIYSRKMLKALMAASKTKDALIFITIRLIRHLGQHPKFFYDASTLKFGPLIVDILGNVETSSQLSEVISLLRLLSEGPMKFRKQLVGPTGGLAAPLVQLLDYPLTVNTPGAISDILWAIYNLCGSRKFSNLLLQKGFNRFAMVVATCKGLEEGMEHQKLCLSILRYAGRDKHSEEVNALQNCT
ncbi:hypothetical protein AAMO2058_001151100 [Amorphochlora amoebiformis]